MAVLIERPCKKNATDYGGCSFFGKSRILKGGFEGFSCLGRREGTPPIKRRAASFPALAIDPGYLRLAYRAPLASGGRGPVVFLVRLKPLNAARPLVPGRRCARKKKRNTATPPRFAL